MEKLIDECNILSSAEFSQPDNINQALTRINQFVIKYQTLIFTSICFSFILLMFVYYPFVWVVSITPLPFIIYKVLLTKKFGLTKIMSNIEENEITIICGMVGAYVAYCCHAIIPMMLSMTFPLILCLVLGSFHETKKEKGK
ncbi:hypothetical protein EDI_162870 [Entamoeba dispar SAW760]|uniref:PRA1 family protein n=1 Tax=Entamoeba dispar (strain ATCC PRA-260 / SAW760) TaxID=370354 RepID=B0ECP8_ENTDS|nr:uncharacterized protein EDI_162870 [Entamoeba dispar SAW760]EDR27685.1 hypothetical protein EDI_162870 [Entamoeba dispar SAW760]|eukprot:EDR27685.1 hypothetical protein EDI_162870 [Entamoeba dispar SAW760]